MTKWRRVSGSAMIVVVLGAVAAPRAVFWALDAWGDYTGPGIASRTGFNFVFYVLCSAATAVAFAVWLTEVRRNVRRAGWPVVSRWSPKVVDDVWRASHPARHTSALVTTWWWSLLIACVLTGAAVVAMVVQEPGLAVAWLVTAAAAAGVTALILMMVVVRRISLMQEDAGLARAA